MHSISIDRDLGDISEIPVAKGDRYCFSARFEGIPCFVKQFDDGARASYESEMNAILMLQECAFAPTLLGFDDAKNAICIEWIEGKQACEFVNQFDDGYLCHEMGRVYGAITTAAKQVDKWHIDLLEDACRTLKGECWSDEMEALYKDAKKVTWLKGATTHTDYHFENVMVKKDSSFMAVDFEGFGCDAPSITAMKVAFNPLFKRRGRVEQEMRLESFSNGCELGGVEIESSEYPIAGAFWALTYAAYHIRNLGKYSVTRDTAVMPCHEIYEFFSRGR